MPLTVKKRGKIWHYSGTVAGRRLRKSTGAASKEVAQRIANDREAKEWKGHLDGPAAVLTFAQASLAYRAARKSPRFLNRIEDYWKDTLVTHITDEAIRASAITLYPGCGPSTWNRQVIVPTQAVINYTARLKLCPHLLVERFKVARKERPYATWEWVQAFMAQANSPRVAALPCFMFFTAARISEALRLTWDDVDLKNRRVLITMGKLGGDQRWAHMPVPLFEAIANLPGDRDGDALVFGFENSQNCKTQWRSAIRRAGIQKLTPHSCRHGFATTALQRGIDVKTVAELGGWKTPALVLSTYAHSSRDPTITERLWSGEKLASEGEKKYSIK